MTQADSVHSTPPLNTSLPQGFVSQERAREKALRRVSKLRKQAADQIEKLIAFLDASDDYTMTEREPNGDEADASYPRSGSHVCSPMEDDEEAGDENEPSLGSTATHETRCQERWSAGNLDDREADPADDPLGEQVNEDGGDDCDNEPMLGWTADGQHGSHNTEQGDECEVVDHAGMSERKRRQRARPANPAIVNFDDPNAGKVIVNRLKRGFSIDAGRRP